MKKAKNPTPSPKESSKAIVFRPHPGPQTKFLASPADLCIYGGAAGGGKTLAAIMETIRHLNNPEFRVLIIRQTYAQITKPGAIWDEASAIYPRLGGKDNKQELKWTFPSGATVSFGYLSLEKDRFNYDGAQVPLIVFDQLEQISGTNFFYMLSRNRSTCGVAPYMRATCNPNPDSFLAEFLGWWLDPETGFPIMERMGKIRWMLRINDTIIWADTKQELIDRYTVSGKKPLPISVAFIPAKLQDNPTLMKINPQYEANLEALDYVSRMRLLEGNWKVRHTAGTVFNRSWFKIIDALPVDIVEIVRYWDRAATIGAGDWTVGLLMGRSRENKYYIIDVIRGQWNAGDVETIIQQTADLDRDNYLRWIRHTGIEREGGSSGKESADRIVRLLAGHAVFAESPSGSKLQRVLPFAAQCNAGNVALLRGSWNSAYIDELVGFPDGSNDDQVDTSSGAFNKLTTPVKQIRRPLGSIGF